jgi:hypothetical protein
MDTNTKGFLMGLKMKLPEQPKPEFDETQRFDNYFIGDTQVMPRAQIEGSVQNNAKIPLGTIDGEAIYGSRDRKRAFGNVGLDFANPNSMVDNVPTTFGVGASGQYFKGEDKFPTELKQFGYPDSQEYGKGLTVDQLNAYLNTPLSENVDLGINARISPYYSDPVDGRMLGKDKYISGEIRYKF